MAIEVRRAGPEDYGRWVKQLVCGHPGAGKTRTASTWPGVLYLNAEGGMMSVRDRQPPVVEISSSQTVNEVVQVLGQRPDVRAQVLGTEVQTVCVDTFDQLVRILTNERLDSTKKDAMAIADWGWLGEQLRGMVRAFRNLEMNVIFNCHLKSQEDSETGRTTYAPAVAGAVGDELPLYFDLAFLLVARPRVVVVNGENRREIVRYMQSYPDVNHPWIKDRSGCVPMEFPIDFETDYKRLDEYIYGGLADQKPQTSLVVGTAPASPAPVASVAAPSPAPAPAPKSTVPDPDPTPVPAPTPVAEPVAEDPDSEEAPEVPAPRQDSVPTSGTAAEAPPEPTGAASADAVACESCGGTVESKDQWELSYIRFRKYLCRRCFVEINKK